MTGVPFRDVVAQAEHVHPDALAVGTAFAAQIPAPSLEHGLWPSALWWSGIGKLIPLGLGNDADAAKKPNPFLLHEGWSVEEVASSDPSRIEDWWGPDGMPMANIGFPTRANGILIIDLDPRHDGVENWRKLCQEHNADDRWVPRSQSPSVEGGSHLWFRLPDGGTFPHSPLTRGVDRPWQVPVPPSMRPVTLDPQARGAASQIETIRPYTWLSGDPRVLPTAPEWLLVTTSVTKSDGDEAQYAGTPVTDTGALDVDALADRGVPPGSQSYNFKRVACSMYRQCYSDTQILNRLREMAANSVQDENRPWRDSDFEYIIRKSHDFVDGQRDQERKRNAQVTAHIRRWL